MPKPKDKVLGLFAGVGGIEFGFKRAGFSIALANEIDPYASKTYRLNHNHPLVEGSISDLTIEKIAEYADPATIGIITGGFPCQPFSVAGHRRGFNDDRGNLFWEIHRLVREIQPEVVLLENVKNLQAHDEGRTFATIKSALEGETADPSGKFIQPGYFVDQVVLNSVDFGIPQNRERIFIIAFKDESVAKNFSWPKGRTENRPVRPLSDFIDYKSDIGAKYHYENNPIFQTLDAEMVNTDTVYQWRRHYVRENKSGVCPTLTANMGMGGHNVPLVRTSHGIRKLTPRECFSLMGMHDLKLPVDIVDSRLYKQAGNAVVVPVIEAIAHQILKALEN